MAKDRSAADRAKVRTACIVIIVAMIGWMAASALGGALGLPVRYAFLFDFAALAALAWSAFVLFQVWRAGQAGDR